jgi:hypothetical protein
MERHVIPAAASLSRLITVWLQATLLAQMDLLYLKAPSHQTRRSCLLGWLADEGVGAQH